MALATVDAHNNAYIEHTRGMFHHCHRSSTGSNQEPYYSKIIFLMKFMLTVLFLYIASAILSSVLFILGPQHFRSIASFSCLSLKSSARTVQNGNGRVRLNVHRISRRNRAYLLGIHEDYRSLASRLRRLRFKYGGRVPDMSPPQF